MRRPLFLLLLALPALSWGADEDSTPAGEETTLQTDTLLTPSEETDITWMDDSHAFATDRAQKLTEWMDSFFGDPVYEEEKPASLLRLEWENSWDQHDNYNARLRLRGKLRLPALSERINIIFSGEDGDAPEQAGQNSGQSDQDNAEILYRVGDGVRQRVDLTLGLNTDGLKPGIRYRNQAPLSDNVRYRYTQRLEWESKEDFYTTGLVNLDYIGSDTQLTRWSNRIKYGEQTLGAEWRTGLSYRQKFETPTLNDPFVLSYFATVNGFTDPAWVENYRVGMLFRRQFLRRYFFVEVEPSYNLRKREDDENRDGVWNIELRFEILFETGRQRTQETIERAQEAKARAAQRQAALWRTSDAFTQPLTRRPDISQVFLSKRGEP